MANTIPASQLVNVQPGVVDTGGTALSLNGVMLTTSTLIPTNTVVPFATLADVKALFGNDSPEAQYGAVYFKGFSGANIRPEKLYFFRYITPEDAPYAWLRGAKLDISLNQLKAMSGSILLTVNGDTVSATINLSAATSFSDAADIIETELDAALSVVWNTDLKAFVFTATNSAPTSTMTYATGSLATLLKITEETGATISQGAEDSTPVNAMDAIVLQTQNWATFTTIFTEPDFDTKLAFADWVNNSNLRYAYVMWDSDINAKSPDPDSETIGHYLKTNNYEGTIPVYGADPTLAAFVMGSAASIDFTEANGRITFAFKGQSGLVPNVTNATAATNLLENGYNFYGAYATATQQFNLFQNGQITGIYVWADAYINQIYLNSGIQQAIMSAVSGVKSLPYNEEGYNLLRAACQDPINQALNFGSIRTGIPLSEEQKAEIKYEAGLDITGDLYSNGYYLQILPASAQVRGNRTSPPMKLWYTDGGSIQQINLASIDVM